MRRGKGVQETSAAAEGPASASNDLCNAPLTLIHILCELHTSTQWKRATADADESESSQTSSPPSQTPDLFDTASNPNSSPPLPVHA